MKAATKRIGEVGRACGSLLRRPFNLPGWQGAALVLACVLFSFSAVRTRFDHHRFEAFLETAGAPGASVAFVTTAADCLALMEDVHELAGQLTVPTRIFVIEDGVSASDLDRLDRCQQRRDHNGACAVALGRADRTNAPDALRRRVSGGRQRSLCGEYQWPALTIGGPVPGEDGRTVMRAAPVVALCSLILSAACVDSPDGPVLFDRGSEDRIVRTSRYDTMWHYGGIQDTLLGGPTRLAATPDNALYVLDPMLRQVTRFSAQGAVEWSWGAKGEGPGEIASVRALGVTPGGGVLLADSGNCRLVFLSPTGLLEREQTIVCDDFSLIEGVAVLSSGDVILDTNRMAVPWILVTPDGGQVDITPPWSGFETLHFLQRYGNTAASIEDVWIFGFETGNGWFAMERQQVLGTYPYVEHTDFPEIIVRRNENTTMWRMATQPAYSAFSMDVWRDTMYVVPGGQTRHRMRVIDKYDIRNGRYLFSQSLPDVVMNFAVTGDRTFVLDDRGLYPQITSLRWKEDER